jgi:hypothetical protein
VTVRDLRRRYRNAVGSRDWLEGVLTLLGVLFLAVAAGCVWGIGVSIATWGDQDPEFRTTPGFLQATRGFGIVLFALFAVVSAGVGWFLAGDAVRRLLRRRGP